MRSKPAAPKQYKLCAMIIAQSFYFLVAAAKKTTTTNNDGGGRDHKQARQTPTSTTIKVAETTTTMPALSRLGPGSRAFVKGSKPEEPVLIVRALGSRSWEVERQNRSNGTRTGELMKKTSYQLRKPLQGEAFPGDNGGPRYAARGTTNASSTAASSSGGGAVANNASTQEQVLVEEASGDGNEEVEVVVRGGDEQGQQQQQQAVAQPDVEQEDVVLVMNEGGSNEQVEVLVDERATNNQHETRTEQTTATEQTTNRQQTTNQQISTPTSPPLQQAAAQIAQALMEDSSSISSENIHVPRMENENQQQNSTNTGPPQLLPGGIHVDNDDVSEVSMDDYFTGMEDFPYFFADDEDAIDPNSAALAHELERRDVYRVKHQKYVARKKQLVDENWKVHLEAPKRNGIEIGDLVYKKVNGSTINRHYGVVVGKHPDSVHGNPLWNVQFDGENHVEQALSGGNQIRLIHDNRAFTWQIVDGDTKPDNPVEEFQDVGVIGFDFQQSFSAANLSIDNEQYDFPFMRLLLHLWPGKCLIAKCPGDCFGFLSTNSLYHVSKGSWRQQLNKLNQAIDERNEGRLRSRHLRSVSEFEWWAFWGIIIGASPCHKGGIQLFDDAPAYRKFSPSVNVSKGGMDVMSKTRFFDIKEIVHRAFEGENSGNPWNKIQPLIDGFNENRHQTVATSSTVTLDEIMSPFQPRTTQSSTLPHLSYIQRKPKPLGTEMKVSWCFCSSCVGASNSSS